MVTKQVKKYKNILISCYSLRIPGKTFAKEHIKKMVIFEECTTLLRNSFLNITLKENGSALHRDLVGVVMDECYRVMWTRKR